jgi:hypothetical protein
VFPQIPEGKNSNVSSLFEMLSQVAPLGEWKRESKRKINKS